MASAPPGAQLLTPSLLGVTVSTFGLRENINIQHVEREGDALSLELDSYRFALPTKDMLFSLVACEHVVTNSVVTAVQFRGTSVPRVNVRTQRELCRLNISVHVCLLSRGGARGDLRC